MPLSSGRVCSFKSPVRSAGRCCLSLGGSFSGSWRLEVDVGIVQGSLELDEAWSGRWCVVVTTLGKGWCRVTLWFRYACNISAISRDCRAVLWLGCCVAASWFGSDVTGLPRAAGMLSCSGVDLCGFWVGPGPDQDFDHLTFGGVVTVLSSLVYLLFEAVDLTGAGCRIFGYFVPLGPIVLCFWETTVLWVLGDQSCKKDFFVNPDFFGIQI